MGLAMQLKKKEENKDMTGHSKTQTESRIEQ